MGDKVMNKARLDRLQIATFQMLFKLRLPAVGVEMASAIADTGDHRFRAALEKNPHLVAKWLKAYAVKKGKQRGFRGKK